MELIEILKEFAARIFTPLRVFIVLVAVSILAVAGPFGTYEFMSIFQRVVYWGLLVMSAVLIITAIKMVVSHLYSKLSYWQFEVTISVIFTVIYSPIVIYWGHTMADADHTHSLPAWMSFLIVFSVSMAIVQIRYLLQSQEQNGRARLFDRFADRSAKRIYRVTVRDHYVDVFTDRGIETLLMRFSDAIAELDGIKGNQVHRSHWVACNAIVRLDRENGKYMLSVKDSGKVPVSRSYRAKVEARLADRAASESQVALFR